MLGKLIVAQIPVLPKLHHCKQHDKGTEDKMPVLEFASASVAKDEWRCSQPRLAEWARISFI